MNLAFQTALLPRSSRLLRAGENAQKSTEKVSQHTEERGTREGGEQSGMRLIYGDSKRAPACQTPPQRCDVSLQCVRPEVQSCLSGATLYRCRATALLAP